MQYTVNKLEKGKVEVKVDVPKAGFEEAYRLVLEKLGSEVKVEGFRPGKVPPEFVEQRLGTNKLLNETASFLISKHLSEIFKNEDLVPLDSPKIAIDTLTHGSPFAFTASFTLKPRVKVGDWRKVKIKKIAAKKIGDEDVEKSIENIYEAWRKQKVANVASTDAKALADKQVSRADAEVSEGKSKFIYNAKGEKIFIKDEESKSKAKVESVDRIGDSGDKKSGIDDDFAKAIGARDLAHLKELVRKDLETIVADQIEQKFEEEIFEKIREIGQVEVPEVLIEDELNRILVRLSTQLEQQGKTLDDFLKEEKTTIDELKAKWREQAEKNVKTSLVLDAIGKEADIKVSQEEVETAMKGVNQTNITAEQKMDLERYIVFSIFQSKTLSLVKQTVGV